ncbi:phosphatidate cytidylyltransferase [Methanomicrobium antiquum]|uniref:Phosphatidate cytidylyltransferase n=1 Tax=Methanomicrobium antiquum TaxID=487686 RepID=A0AAF0FN91_9EURY|nr:phosphatidate cytidylyltransferase [Methanomicrobium antiquum]WFN37428.1 phosphatidate cytidylyltransferase [Methanomicrobium antiquum]
MKETYRQFSHLLFGLLICAFIYIAKTEVSIYTFIAVIFTGVIIADAISRGINVPLFSYLIKKLERDGSFPGKGALFFFVGVLFCLRFFGEDITITSIIVLSVLDSVSTVAGLNFGKHKIYGKKSLEGTVLGITASIFVLIFFISPITAVILSVIAGIAELISPVDDNLTIPVVSCVCLFFLDKLFII